jgi:hypothetical protein
VQNGAYRVAQTTRAFEAQEESRLFNGAMLDAVRLNKKNMAITECILKLNSNTFTIGYDGSTGITENDKKTFTLSEIILNFSSAVTADLYGDYNVDELTKILAQDAKVWKVRVS